MTAFLPSDKMQVLLVDPDGDPYTLAGLFALGTFRPSDKARVCLVDENGNPYKASASGGGAEIQVEGVDTSDQTLANFVAGANITITNPSGGIIQIDSSASGSGLTTGSQSVTLHDQSAVITHSLGNINAILVSAIANFNSGFPWITGQTINTITIRWPNFCPLNPGSLSWAVTLP